MISAVLQGVRALLVDLLRGGRAQVVQHGHLKAGVVRLTRGALDGERRADARQQQMMAPMLP